MQNYKRGLPECTELWMSLSSGATLDARAAISTAFFWNDARKLCGFFDAVCGKGVVRSLMQRTGRACRSGTTDPERHCRPGYHRA